MKVTLVVLVLLLIWLSDWNPFSDRVNSYVVWCLGELQGGECEGSVVTSWITTYRVNDASETVTWIGGDKAYEKYDNCTIKDKQNWRCDIHTDYKIVFENGLEVLGFGNSPNHYAVRKWQYYLWYLPKEIATTIPEITSDLKRL